MLLASASQDRYVRLWKIQRDEPQAADPVSVSSAASVAPAASGGDGSALTGASADGTGDGGLAAAISRYAPRPAFLAGGAQLRCSLEALLIGHEDWVHSVQWAPPPAGQDVHSRCARLPLLVAYLVSFAGF